MSTTSEFLRRELEITLRGLELYSANQEKVLGDRYYVNDPVGVAWATAVEYLATAWGEQAHREGRWNAKSGTPLMERTTRATESFL